MHRRYCLIALPGAGIPYRQKRQARGSNGSESPSRAPLRARFERWRRESKPVSSLPPGAAKEQSPFGLCPSKLVAARRTARGMRERFGSLMLRELSTNELLNQFNARALHRFNLAGGAAVRHEVGVSLYEFRSSR